MQNGQKFSDGANRFRSAFSAVSQASPQKQGQGGHTTPLHEAARKYEVDKIASLLRQGCDPNALDGSRCQPLHILLYDEFEGHINSVDLLRCVKLLLKANCEVNVVDGYGETPLSWAVQNKLEGCVKSLVKYGADTTVRTRKYKNKYSMAIAIAKHMPDALTKMLDKAVTLEQNQDFQKVVKLDWSPLLQKENQGKPRKDGLRSKFRADRELDFLCKMLDVPLEARFQYLNHPLVLAFMHLKERRMRVLLTVYQLFMAVFTVLYLVFVYIMYFEHCRIDREDDGDEDGQDEKHGRRCDLTTPIKACGTGLAVIAALLFLKEVYLQLRTDTTYLKNWNTWASWISLLLMGFTLWPTLQFQKSDYHFGWQHPVASIGAFFSGILFLVHFELIPKAKLYLEQLVKILLTVLKIILLFIPIFVGLFIGFNVMFFEDTTLMNFMLMAVDPGSDNYESMIEEIAEDGDARFIVVANIFCAAFILIISIVFMNYLLAASVEDIQEMKKNAKTVVLSKKVETMFSFEVFSGSYFALVSPQDLQDGSCYFEYDPRRMAKNGKRLLPPKIRMPLMDLLQHKTERTKSKILKQKAVQSLQANVAQRFFPGGSSSPMPQRTQSSAWPIPQQQEQPAGFDNYAFHHENNNNYGGFQRETSPTHSGNSNAASVVMPPSDFVPGQNVFVQSNSKGEGKWTFGIIIREDEPESYLIDVNGKRIRRHKNYIRKAT